jgi:hypothetical protein
LPLYDVGIDACIGPERMWVNYPSNFDNFFVALATTVEIATMEMWPNLMARVIDSAPYGMGAIKDYHWWASLFFMAVVIVCSLFVMGLFVGVVVNQYKIQNQVFTGALNLTPAQRYYLQSYKEMVYNPPPVVDLPPEQHKCGYRLRMACYKLIKHKAFEGIIISCIICNVVLMMMAYDNMPADYNAVLEGLGHFFSFVFFMEMVFKFSGLGPRQYLRDRWNLFDMMIVSISIFSVALLIVGMRVGPSSLLSAVFLSAR